MLNKPEEIALNLDEETKNNLIKAFELWEKQQEASNEDVLIE